MHGSVNLRSDFFFFFQGRARREEKIYIKKNSLSVYSRERHRGIIGRGHDLRQWLSLTLDHGPKSFNYSLHLFEPDRLKIF